jgi:hypothetical protein
MKRILSLILTFVLLLSFTACSGNFAQVDLKEPIALADDGIVERDVFEKIKNENAIATFTGESSEMEYEWTIFGSDLKDTKDVNLSITLEKTEKGIKIKFSETEDFGFPALLSVHLNEKWKVDSATAFDDGSAVYSVSITGSKTSILNISVNKIVAECEVLPDDTKQTESTPSTETTAPDNDDKDSSETNKTDSYLSDDTKQTESTPSTETTAPDNDDKDSSETNKTDSYLSDVKDSDNRVYSDGQNKGKDKYETDPVPEGKPLPVEPEDQEFDKKKTYTCTFSIECSTILNNLKELDPDKRELVPSNGVILAPTKVTFYEGESVFDVLQRVCKEKGIHMESSWTPIYNSAYIEGIHNLYEFDCGELSGWMYRVNGWYPNYGCSRYQLVDGEVVEWRYTCDLGNDVGREGTW